MNDYKTSEHHYLNIILEEIEYSEWYKIKKNEILLLACGRVDEKKISPGRSGGNIVIFFIRLRPKFWALTFFQAFLLSQQLNTMELSSNMQNQQNLM